MYMNYAPSISQDGWGFSKYSSHRLIYVRTANCKYNSAEAAWAEAQVYLGELRALQQPVCVSVLYAEYCALLFSLSNYDKVVEVVVARVKARLNVES